MAECFARSSKCSMLGVCASFIFFLADESTKLKNFSASLILITIMVVPGYFFGAAHRRLSWNIHFFFVVNENEYLKPSCSMENKRIWYSWFTWFSYAFASFRFVDAFYVTWNLFSSNKKKQRHWTHLVNGEKTRLYFDRCAGIKNASISPFPSSVLLKTFASFCTCTDPIYLPLETRSIDSK